MANVDELRQRARVKVKWSELSPRERDALIAQDVLDYKVSWWSLHPTDDDREEYRPDADGDCPTHLMFSFGEWKRIPHYTQRMSDAWEVFQNIKGRPFTERKQFMDELQRIVSRRKGVEPGKLIDWPDVFWFVEPDDICLAALRAVGVEVEE